MAQRRVCPDTCRRGGASATMDGPWYCASCRGLREDMNEPERQAIRAWNDRHAVEEVWLRHYGLPSVLKPMIRELPVEVPVAELHKHCSFPLRPDAIAASDRCGAIATSVVRDQYDSQWYRCGEHRGQVDGLQHGRTFDTMPRPR